MKIYIKEENHNPIKIRIPNSIIMNRFVASIGSRTIKQTNNIQISSNDLNQLFKAIKESKRMFGNYCLVEVESNDGEIVRIEL